MNPLDSKILKTVLLQFPRLDSNFEKIGFDLTFCQTIVAL